ncbi:hypothetical protein P0082_12090 [Candidatus Haliotispira prima]|uniref:Uncharacterized protein n=1 Tax=Candidatus Haliotispira prima TaxID=3034016 RepID=A0ABY8MGV2_9SPIO|nr:hypothetical protein P0082_12090 [Candidatus Haliotispira prima]
MFYRFVSSPKESEGQSGQSGTVQPDGGPAPHFRRQTPAKCLVLFVVLQDIEPHTKLLDGFGNGSGESANGGFDGHDSGWRKLLRELEQQEPLTTWHMLLVDTGAAVLRRFYGLIRSSEGIGQPAAEQAAVDSLKDLLQQPGFRKFRFYFSRLSDKQVRMRDPVIDLSSCIHVENAVLEQRFFRGDTLAGWEFWTHPICNWYYSLRYGLQTKSGVCDTKDGDEHADTTCSSPSLALCLPKLGPGTLHTNVAADLYGLAKISSDSLNVSDGLTENTLLPGMIWTIRQNLASHYCSLDANERQDNLEQGISYAHSLQFWPDLVDSGSLWQEQIRIDISPSDLQKLFVTEAPTFQIRRHWQQQRALPWSNQLKKMLKYILPYGLVRQLQDRGRQKQDT